VSGEYIFASVVDDIWSVVDDIWSVVDDICDLRINLWESL